MRPLPLLGIPCWEISKAGSVASNVDAYRSNSITGYPVSHAIWIRILSCCPSPAPKIPGCQRRHTDRKS